MACQGTKALDRGAGSVTLSIMGMPRAYRSGWFWVLSFISGILLSLLINTEGSKYWFFGLGCMYIAVILFNAGKHVN